MSVHTGSPQELDRIQAFYERVYKQRIKQKYDAVTLIIGDESTGKSTFILESIWFYQEIRGLDPTPGSVLDQIIWRGRQEFKNALIEFPRRSAIAVPDAGRVFYRKDAMVGEQKEVEKDLLDSRVKENLILLGFQDWKIIPSMLQERRAKFAFYIPRRGRVYGYGRAKLDEWVETGERPEPDLNDWFPSLEGKRIWSVYEEKDLEMKKERMAGDTATEETEEVDLFEIANDIQTQGIEEVVSIHGGNKQPYIDSDLIELNWDLNAQQARKVKKLLDKQTDPAAVVTE